MRIRRYKVEEASQDVEDRAVHSLLNQEEVHFEVELTDVYERLPPIPTEVQRRKIGMRVIRLALSHGGNLKALGFTEGHSGVTITIPKNKEEESVMAFLDREKHS